MYIYLVVAYTVITQFISYYLYIIYYLYYYNIFYLLVNVTQMVNEEDGERRRGRGFVLKHVHTFRGNIDDLLT